MPAVTYLGECQHLTPVSDKVLNSLIGEVRRETGEDWRISEQVCLVRRGWFRRSNEVRLYTLYYGMDGNDSIEFQVINFYRPDNEGSMSFANDAGLVAAYLCGILSQCSKKGGA